ncbi:hypothetical protein [Nostoc sp.]
MTSSLREKRFFYVETGMLGFVPQPNLQLHPIGRREIARSRLINL